MAAPSVVVVGAGQGGTETAAALRGRGFSGRITLVGAEDALPYQRPPLSKGYLTGGTPADELPLRPRSFFAAQDIELVTGTPVTAIDPDGMRISLAQGGGRRVSLRYDHLVLATGARPRVLPVPGASLAGVHTLGDQRDALALRAELRPGAHLLVVGGGFVGLELASTARLLGLEVTVVEAAARVMGRSASAALAEHLTAGHRAHGARVLTRREVVALRGDDTGRVRVAELDGGERVPADVVVMGVGVLPRTGLAADAGLPVGDGVLVDRTLRAGDPAVHAIGDCARFPSPHAGRPLRLESVQNASDQARCVAADICGAPEPYTAVPWFWTEQCGLRVQIAGSTAGHDRTVVSGDVAGGRFSVFCFAGERLVGVESVNRPADHMITRRLLAEGGAALPSAAEVSHPDFDLRKHRRARQPQ
ncbi:FAD-dependent oxidoreductase [Streptomyces ferrugineus]|uniref:FAD-dependent oxidoreductase n=1 Tax=Streptomyces ferrugineus TaxID=1413221 RepID=A0A7M2SHC7_9ACTN|nr:FAD-dependent oxidoreductase [Streptomyces ferrugineus]QOV35730.1 FAD-dependent oxidoreductase [Streptomyces ferrugineus]